MVRVKICGLTKFEDAEQALEHGADALGFVYEPTSPRYIGGDPELSTMPFRFSPYAVTVGVYGEMAESVDPCLIAQYVDQSRVKSLKERFAGVAFRELRPVVRAFRVRSGHTVQEIKRDLQKIYEQTPNMHAALIDAYDPEQYGGTGKRVDWDLVAELVAQTEIPIVLAGGLTPENVAEAVTKVKPYAVDVSSGVELSPGVKDVHKVRDFILAAKSAGKK
jgi:phosphoribosylanthranilate isomerase